MSNDLGPKPDARIEPGEPNPGGVDAVDADQSDDGPAIPDLPSDKNPAVASETPDEVTQGSEDTSTRATQTSGEEGDTPSDKPDEEPA